MEVRSRILGVYCRTIYYIVCSWPVIYDETVDILTGRLNLITNAIEYGWSYNIDYIRVIIYVGVNYVLVGVLINVYTFIRVIGRN